MNAPVAKPIPMAMGTGFSMGPNSDTRTHTHEKTHTNPAGIPIPVMYTSPGSVLGQSRESLGSLRECVAQCNVLPFVIIWSGPKPQITTLSLSPHSLSSSVLLSPPSVTSFCHCHWPLSLSSASHCYQPLSLSLALLLSLALYLSFTTI